jgi:hypothetical protein
MRSTHDYTDLVNDWLTETNGRGYSIIDQVRIVMSRLKLKVNNCFIKGALYAKIVNFCYS